MSTVIETTTGTGQTYIDDLARVLVAASFPGRDGGELPADDGYARWRDLTLRVRAQRTRRSTPTAHSRQAMARW